MHPQKMLYASLFGAALALPFSSAAYANIVISIDKSTQRMLVSVDGQTRYDWPVSTGRAGYDTPSGVFKINRMDVDHRSKEYDNAFMPDSMFFDLKGHAIHGFNDVPQLGMAVSHGCVRLSPAHGAVLFSLVKQEGMANTTVQISGHIPQRSAPLVAQRPGQMREATNEPPLSVAPGYGQPAPYGYDNRPAYGQPYGQGYGQGYGRGYGQGYGQDSQQAQAAFPPQPRPYYYGRPAYQPYGGQGYYQQPYGYSQPPQYGYSNPY